MTMTGLVEAAYDPSYMSNGPWSEPSAKEPPWKKIIMGRGSEAERTDAGGVQTLRLRQASDKCFGTSGLW